jgi:hypothetical protein
MRVARATLITIGVIQILGGTLLLVSPATYAALLDLQPAAAVAAVVVPLRHVVSVIVLPLLSIILLGWIRLNPRTAAAPAPSQDTDT